MPAHVLPDAPELVDNELALAEHYLHYHGKDLAWIQERRQWVRWKDVEGWRDDASDTCMAEIQKIGLSSFVKMTANGPILSRVTGGSLRTARSALASAAPYVASSMKDWDASPELVGVRGAMVVDLRTMSVRAMKREDRIRQQIPTLPDFNVPEGCRWRRFIQEALPDPMTREYVMRLAGYSLTGHAREHVIPFLYGAKRLGKSTMFNAIREAMGDYSTVSLASNYQKNNGIHKTFYAKLAGSRAVFLTEIPRGFQLDEGLVKSISGGEPLEANFMNRNPFTFQPQFTLWLIGNNAPTMSERDGGLLARIKVVEFNSPPAVMDPTLPEILKGEEQKYVVADLITAAAEYLAGGLGGESVDIAKSNEEYASMADTLSMFFGEVLEPDLHENFVTGKQLFSCYVQWVEDAKQKHPYGKHGFFRAIREGDYHVGGERLKETKQGSGKYPGVAMTTPWFQHA